MNRRPQDYESCALTSWATTPFRSKRLQIYVYLIYYQVWYLLYWNNLKVEILRIGVKKKTSHLSRLRSLAWHLGVKVLRKFSRCFWVYLLIDANVTIFFYFGYFEPFNFSLVPFFILRNINFFNNLYKLLIFKYVFLFFVAKLIVLTKILQIF